MRVTRGGRPKAFVLVYRLCRAPSSPAHQRERLPGCMTEGTSTSCCRNPWSKRKESFELYRDCMQEAKHKLDLATDQNAPMRLDRVSPSWP